MKLRKLARLCEHDELFEHRWEVRGRLADDAFFCPGGVFLPDDTLVVEKVDGEWPEQLAAQIGETKVDHRSNVWWGAIVRDGRKRLDGLVATLDALSVREAE